VEKEIDWKLFDDNARAVLDKDFVYYVRTTDGKEYSGMYPNYAGFHCQNPGEPRRVSMSNVTHFAVQMSFEDHADKYVFNRT